MEPGWPPRMLAGRLYACRLPVDVFWPHRWAAARVTGEPAETIEQMIINDLVSSSAS
jgi:hypothetical protein